MKGMALASLFGPARIDLCFLASGFTPTHVYSKGGGWDSTVPLGAWDLLGGEFATAPVMVATKASIRPVNEPPVGAAGGTPPPTTPPTPPPHHVPGGLSAAPGLEHLAAEGPGATPHELASVVHGPAGSGGVTPFGPRPRLDVFAVGTDLALRHQVLWDGALSTTPGWENLGGVFISRALPLGALTQCWVRAADAAGHTGPWATSLAVTPAAIQEGSSAITHRGAWTVRASTSA